ncbi:MAG TPA: radical SAM peptide maturase, CXXX-repeat target family [Candidatus Acidoferrales bacterium]|nr:radical SAM peptide maturase, CXXX-repeat target family [Candidatus Acidoferrales bacterium]
MDYIFGKNPKTWGEAVAKNVTLIVTEDCQLRCRYCYLHGKNHQNRMSFDIARQTVEYLLRERQIFTEQSVIWDFIGGEPFLEIELIDQVSDYIKRRMYEESHPWFNSYRFSFSTNGILYDHPKVQKYIEKNKTHLSIGITIDGSQPKHDMQRVYPNGRGSYADVVRNVPLWLSQFPGSGSKVTVSHADLPFIFESVLHLWDLGIKSVYINVVFENVWQEGDDMILEEQLVKLADYVLLQRLFTKANATFFSDSIGQPLDCVRDNQNWCGAGKMLAVDYKGDFYPCIRFAPYSMAKQKPRCIGNCFEGIDQNKLRPFLALDRVSQSSEECIKCEVARGCAWCQGLNYDEADSDTIYQRAVFICKMHKARVRANNYYWERFRKISGGQDRSANIKQIDLR